LRPRLDRRYWSVVGLAAVETAWLEAVWASWRGLLVVGCHRLRDRLSCSKRGRSWARRHLVPVLDVRGEGGDAFLVPLDG
jgi:hypothetical protein